MNGDIALLLIQDGLTVGAIWWPTRLNETCL
jgi:hypothetical protein